MLTQLRGQLKNNITKIVGEVFLEKNSNSINDFDWAKK